MVYILDLTNLYYGAGVSKSLMGYAPHESFLQRLETDEYNDEVVFTEIQKYPTSGYVIINGQPTYEEAPGVKEIIKESVLPTWEAVLLFFQNYWYLIALIILGIIAVIAL